MPSDWVVAVANTCQMAVPVISLSAYLPQWIKLIRTRSSRDISLRSWCIWTVSACFALFYAVVQLWLNGRGWPLVVSTALGLLFVLFTLFLILRYRPKGKGREISNKKGRKATGAPSLRLSAVFRGGQRKAVLEIGKRVRHPNLSPPVGPL